MSAYHVTERSVTQRYELGSGTTAVIRHFAIKLARAAKNQAKLGSDGNALDGVRKHAQIQNLDSVLWGVYGCSTDPRPPKQRLEEQR